MKSLFSSMRHKIRSQKKLHWLRQRQSIATTPYPLSLYSAFLNQISNHPSCSWFPFATKEPLAENRARFFVRHDIDEPLCPKRLDSVLHIDESFNIKSGIYFRVDGQSYDPSQQRDLAYRWKNKGFEIGLHSSCYLADDFVAELKKEIQIFKDALGFQPESLTVHGLGDYRLQQRRVFEKSMVMELQRFGFHFSDCHPRLFAYDHVIEDCHQDEDGGRILLSDFKTIPPFILPGSNYLILTHPCYWEKQ